MSGRIVPIFRDHADKEFAEPRRRLSWPAVIVTLAVLAGAGNFVSLVLGLQHGIEIGRDRERREAAYKPKRMAPAPAEATTRWGCTKDELAAKRQEFAEYREACQRRAINEIIKRKG